MSDILFANASGMPEYSEMDNFILGAVIFIAILRVIFATLQQVSQQMPQARTFQPALRPLRITPPSARRQLPPRADESDLSASFSLDEAEEVFEEVEELPEAEPVDDEIEEEPPMLQTAPLSRFPANMPAYLEGIIWSEILNPPRCKRRHAC